MSIQMRKDTDDHSAGNHHIDVRPQNWMTPVALMLLREESSHGYDLMDRAKEYGFEEINPGTLYRTLRHIEREGLCNSTWETSNNARARRVYSLTDAGEEHLEAWADGCKRYQQVLDSFCRAYDASSR